MRYYTRLKGGSLSANQYRLEITPELVRVTLNQAHALDISIDSLRQRHEWKDACVWGLPLNDSGLPLTLINMSAESLPSRRLPEITSMLAGKSIRLHFIVPHKNADFREIAIRAFLLEGETLESNKTFTELTMAEAESVHLAHLPALALEGPEQISAGGSGKCVVAASFQGRPCSWDLEIHLETVNGYLPKTRLDICGKGVFPVQAMGLEAGDRMKIKAGFRYLAGQAEKIVEVI